MPVRMLRCGFIAMLGLSAAALAQANPNLYSGMRWRSIGPWHGGRVSAVSGAIGEPGVFYMGTPQGGVWKTTSAGVTWFPIMDQVDRANSVDSIGSIAVAPSNPNIVYVGTGDSVGGSHGDGMWKSTDAGKTWTHIGLENTTDINKIVVDPQNPELVLVSAQGDRTHNGRGIFRSSDGGQTWSNVLNPAGFNGTRDLEAAYDVPHVMFAATQGYGGFRFGPQPRGAKRMVAEVFKSTDEGQTWTRLTSPPNFYSRIGLAVAMNTGAQRVYLVTTDYHGGSGFFRSDDGGQSWRHMDPKATLVATGQGNYSCGVWVDSHNPDIVYIANTATYRSVDGGNTFISFKGAPGGEDYHRMWIDPTHPNRMEIGADQGATVTLDYGKTWSLWYHEPIAQLYRVSTTDSYPFWAVGPQQDTGAVAVQARGNMGEINVNNWRPSPSSEFGPLAPDPLDPDILYGVGYGQGAGGSGLMKINVRTGQWEDIAPNYGVRARDYRAGQQVAKHFDTRFDPSALYIALQCLVVTRDGGQNWSAASPDLTVAKGAPAVPCGQPSAPSQARRRSFARGATIADFSISKVRKGVIWTASTNNQIYTTTDGGQHWTNVSNITDFPARAALHSIVAGANAQTAFVAARLGVREGIPASAAPTIAAMPPSGNNVPLIWRTRDGGQTWTKIVNGLPSQQPSGSWVNVVLADPAVPGLVFCGTESAVYVSLDNGNHWQSLQLNLPATSIRDMVLHTYDHMDDLVIATFGRGFWILDDIQPLNALSNDAAKIENSTAYLFPPGDAIRSRENANEDQPFNPEEPHSLNPPYGAAIYYYLGQPPTGTITLDVYDAQGNLVHSESSVEAAPVEGAQYPAYWLSPPSARTLPAGAGMHRVDWNLRYNPPPAFEHDLEDEGNVVEHTVTPTPHGPQVIPGVYTLKLTVNGKTYTRKLTVINDPRVGEGPEVMAELRAQNELNLVAYHGMQGSYRGHTEAAAAQAQLTALEGGSLPTVVAAQAKGIEAKLAALGGTVRRGGGFFFRRGAAQPGQMQSFVEENNSFGDLVGLMVVGLDMAPTPAQIATWESDCRNYERTVAAWNEMQTKTLAAFNHLLSQNHLQTLTLSPGRLSDPSCSLKIK
ncbi:MAG: WD40/YVTN/BNR-like repeat-containing protein [Terriglobales bacterium]